MANLLKQTIRDLAEHGKTLDDILWVGTNEVEIPLPVFKSLANKEYDSGYGSPAVATDLLVCGNGWYMERHEYDGAEWIPVSEPPKECGRYYTNRKLFGGDYVAILQYRIDSDGGYWSYYDDEYGVRLLQDVTHWMPLPTPPKGE